MRSTDGGATWQDHRPGAQPDVHSLAWHPSGGVRAYEAAAAAAAFTEGRRRDLAAGRRGAGPELHVVGQPSIRTIRRLWYVSASTGPFAAHGGGDPQARVYRRRPGDGVWRALAAVYPSRCRPCPTRWLQRTAGSSPGSRTVEIWESGDRGDSWRALRVEGEAITGLHALGYASS